MNLSKEHVTNHEIRYHINCSDIEYILRLDGNYEINIYIFLVLYLALIMLVFIANILVLFTFYNCQRFQKTYYILICCLSVSDIIQAITSLIGLMNITLAMLYHTHSCILYNVGVAMAHYSFILTFIIPCCITGDRYLAISRPFVYSEKMSTNKTLYFKVMSAIFLFNLVLVMVWIVIRIWMYLNMLTCFLVFTATIINTILYTKINRKIKHIEYMYSNLVGANFSMHRSADFERKQQWLNKLIVLNQLFLYLPYLLINLLFSFTHLDKDFMYALTMWTYWLINVKAFINPILYCISLKNFRQRMILSLKRRKIKPIK